MAGAAGFGTTWAVGGTLEIGLAALVLAVAAIHPAIRIRRPGTAATEALLIDLAATLALLGLLRPPAVVQFVALAYVIPSAVLFLRATYSGWVIGVAILGVGILDWTLGSATSLTMVESLVVAGILSVAGLPLITWSIARLVATRVRVETALEETSARFGQLFANSVVPMFRTTPDGEVLDANQALVDLFAAPSLEALRDEPVPMRYVDPGRRSEFVNRMRREGSVRQLEQEFRRLDGAVFWGRLSASFVDTERGPIFEGIIEDVTDTRRARERERLTTAIFDQLASAVVVADSSRRVTTWNRKAEELFGFRDPSTLGRLSQEVLQGDPDLAAEVRRGLEAEGSWHGEADIVGADGSEIPCAVSVAEVDDDRGRRAGFAMVFTDLTDLRRAQETARRLGDLARSVLDSVGFPMALVDHGGEILDVNDAWVRFALENHADLATSGVGANYLEVCRRAARVDPDVADVATGIEEVLAGRADSFSTEYPCHSPTERRWFRMETTPVPGVGAVVAHYDTTGNHLAREALEETVHAKDQFLATVSHELRTPLTAVVGFAQQLRDQALTADELGEVHEMIADQAREVADLVEDLLLVGRLDTGTIAIASQPVEVSEVVEAVVRPWALQLAGEIELDLPGRRLEILSDPLRLRQIVRNLVSNAIRHGDTPVSIRVRGDDTSAVVEVRDAGSGIPDHLLEDLFEPYATASAVRLPGSVGLGLYVSRRLAGLLGGTLEYRRDDGATVFRLVLPG